MALTARYWTKIFVVFVILSYIVAYLFLLVYMWIDTVRTKIYGLYATSVPPITSPCFCTVGPVPRQ